MIVYGTRTIAHTLYARLWSFNSKHIRMLTVILDENTLSNGAVDAWALSPMIRCLPLWYGESFGCGNVFRTLPYFLK